MFIQQYERFFGYVARQISLYKHAQSDIFILWKDIARNFGYFFIKKNEFHWF
jgi:hypothetical protein